MAEDTTLDPTDILALRNVPRVVVLSGCETARSDRNPGVQAMGLAQAFIVRGTADVVAPTRVVDDRHARQLIQRLYSNLEQSGELSVALAQAQRSWNEQFPEADWFAFRHLSR
jgi:CHAT domain-containing protein